VSDLPPSIRRLLARIGGLEQLEVLLFLARDPTRYVSASQVASSLHLLRRLDATLEHLSRENLLDVRLGSDVRYRFTQDPETRDLVRKLAEAYEERRLSVIEALQRTSPAHAFAEAFRIRKDRDDG
jgi:hypothetical protein